MSDIISTLAQIVFTIWPLFVITAFAYSLQGRLTWRALSRRVRENLFITWCVLFLVWLVTLFATLPTPGLIPEPWNSLAFFGGFALLLIAEASRLGLLNRRLHARVNLRRTRSLQDLKNMDPYAFEDLVAETYRSLGFQAKHVGHSGDHGVDIELLSPNGERWIVQCKRYHGTVGESIIRDLYGTMVSEKSKRAVLVTTAHITPPASQWARGKPIDLIDGPALLKLMDEAHRRTERTLLNRLATWLEGWLAPPRPAGLRTQEDAKANQEATQPVRIRLASGVPAIHAASNNNHRAPVCPNCGLTMVPRPPRVTDRPGRALYRCRNYPTCRVVLESSPVKQ